MKESIWKDWLEKPESVKLWKKYLAMSEEQRKVFIVLAMQQGESKPGDLLSLVS